MNGLEEARLKINRIDMEMAALFEERMRIAAEIGEYKKAHGLPVKDTARESALIEKNLSYIENEEIADYYIRFIKSIISLSCEYQSDMR